MGWDCLGVYFEKDFFVVYVVMLCLIQVIVQSFNHFSEEITVK